MVVVVERVAGEPLDPFGLQFTFEAIAHDPLFVHERFFIAFRVGAVEGEVLSTPTFVAVMDGVGRREQGDIRAPFQPLFVHDRSDGLRKRQRELGHARIRHERHEDRYEPHRAIVVLEEGKLGFD